MRPRFYTTFDGYTPIDTRMKKVVFSQTGPDQYSVVRLVNLVSPALNTVMNAAQIQAAIDTNLDTRFVIR